MIIFSTRRLLMILLISIPIFFSCTNKNETETEIEKIEPPKPNIYGLFTDSLRVFEGVVKKNETLADILLPHNISYKAITEIVEISKEKLNVRKINSGKKYKIYSQIDSLETVHYFVYESNPIDFAIIDFTDSVITVETGAKEIEYRKIFKNFIILSRSSFLDLNYPKYLKVHDGRNNTIE